MTIPHHPHRSAWWYIFQVCFGLFQGIPAKIQAVRIAENLPVSHTIWTVIMLLVIVLLVLSYKKLTHCRWKEAIKLAAVLLLIRFLTFTPWLNKLRGKKWFYLGKESFMDRMLTGWYSWAWWSAAALLVGLQFL